MNSLSLSLSAQLWIADIKVLSVHGQKFFSGRCAVSCWIKDESKKCLEGSGERKVSWWGRSVGRLFPILGALIVETEVYVRSTILFGSIGCSR